MKKWLIFVLAVALLLVPTLAYAQSDVKIKNLSVQIWPEYDRPEVLVMYSLELAEDTPLPAELRIRVPVNAELNAVAKLSEGKMLTVPYDPPIREGDWAILTLIVDELTGYRVEYYAPIEKNGSTRNFSYFWESDYDVETLFIELQQPPNSTNLTTTPLFSNTRQDELAYHTLMVGGVPAEKAFALEISYDKDNDNLTVSSMPIEVGGAPESEASTFSLNDSLPTLLAGLGVLLIAGGLLYFFLAGRGDGTLKESRKRHAPRTASAGGNIYCHECGGRARSGDKFCRACGVKLRL